MLQWFEAAADYVPEHLKMLPWSLAYFGLSAGNQSAALNVLTAHLADYETDTGIDGPFRSYLAIVEL